MIFRTIFAIVFLGLLASGALSGKLVGRIDRIYDGDTFWVCDSKACTKIRTCGINAPEHGKPGDLEAVAAFSRFAKGKKALCIPVGQGTVCDKHSKPTSHDRVVAQCSIGAVDIGAWMVEHGHACDWVRYSGGAYSARHPERKC